MYYIEQTVKSFERAVTDLEKAVTNNKFGVLHIHDLGETLRNKGIDFKEECKVFEVCNPKHSSEVMAIDMKINMALPCRISVYTEGSDVKIGLIKPEPLLTALSDDENMKDIAKQVEESLITMVKEVTNG